MDRAELLQGIREMRFEALLDRHERGELGQAEAAEMLGISERTLRRWRDRLRDEGPSGLRDRRIGKPSSRRAAVEEIQRMLGLYEERYSGFTVKHFHEQLVKRHNYKLGYTVTRLSLQGAGLVRPAPKRSAHRKKRPRRPMVGMLLHQDASRFAWLPGDPQQYDLVVTLDDATSAIYSAFLVDEEGTASSFRGLAEVITRHGLFCELYTDRGSHYFHTPKAGEPVSKSVRTQVGRALAQLGIRHIAAYSPEARGRSERAFRTLQSLPRRRPGTAYPRSWHWPASPRWKQPTGLSPSITCRSTTPPSRSRRPRRAAPSSPTTPAGPAKSCASRRNAGSATTTPSAGAIWCCKSRPRRCARTLCAPRCGSTNIPTGGGRCSTDPIAWPITMPLGRSAITPKLAA